LGGGRCIGLAKQVDGLFVNEIVAKDGILKKNDVQGFASFIFLKLQNIDPHYGLSANFIL
jgi:hypothetical protein